jgi:uncharacterized protein (TIGR00369 family)
LPDATNRELMERYPPREHLLRDLGLCIERDAEGSRAWLDVVPNLCAPGAGVRAGVLAALVDIVAGEAAARAASPNWIATSDLVLDLTRPVTGGRATATPRLLRSGRQTVVIEVEISASGGPDPGPAGLAVLGFAVLPSRGGVQRLDPHSALPRTDFALPGSGLRMPLAERLQARVLDAEAGVVEMPVTPYVMNSLGAMQGGALASLVDFAAEAAGSFVGAASWQTTDLAIHYLALGRSGPLRSSARLLRLDPASALLRVELRDTGAGDRVVCVATATTEHFA